MRLPGVFLFLAFWPCIALTAPEGVLRVIDADTFDVGGVRVRLYGVDAPEIGQPCEMDGVERDCGRWVRDLVDDRFTGKHAVCEEHDVDRYGRVVATCVIDGRDLGAQLVSAGWAWAYRKYSDRYDLEEKTAAVAGRGLWGATIQTAAAYRATRVTGLEPPDPACAIKGNISSGGRIYHIPGSASYARTGIDETRGERWFCTQSEAENVGWRPAKS